MGEDHFLNQDILRPFEDLSVQARLIELAGTAAMRTAIQPPVLYRRLHPAVQRSVDHPRRPRQPARHRRTGPQESAQRHRLNTLQTTSIQRNSGETLALHRARPHKTGDIERYVASFPSLSYGFDSRYPLQRLQKVFWLRRRLRHGPCWICFSPPTRWFHPSHTG